MGSNTQANDEEQNEVNSRGVSHGVEAVSEKANKFTRNLIGVGAHINEKYAVAQFVDRVEELVGELESTSESLEVTSGLGCPEGIVGDYPRYWVNLQFEQGAIYAAADALNAEEVSVHLIQHFDVDYVNGESRTYVEMRLEPNLEAEIE